MYLANNLKLLRRHKGLTQEQLAVKAEVSCSSIVNYENGRRTDPPISVVQKIAKALGVTPEFLGDKEVVIQHGIILIENPEGTGKLSDNYNRLNGLLDIQRKRLLELYDRMNEDGKDKAFSYIAYLANQTENHPK